ncbi:hypothetical protein DIPPA_16679 [Diplonema papillatum]|nr:hypothetical protein DIPPA_16679 [Diplonema papillatum]
MVTGDTRGNLRVWDADFAAKTHSLVAKINIDKVACLCADSTGTQHVLAGGGRKVWLVDPFDGETRCGSSKDFSGSINAVALANQLLYAGGDEGVVRSFLISTETREGREVAGGLRYQRSFRGMGTSIMSVAVVKAVVLSGGYDGSIKLWSLATGAVVMALRGHCDAVTSLAFSSPFDLWSASNDSTLKHWELHTGGLVEVVACPAPVLGLVHYEDEQGRGLLVGGTKTGQIQHWVVSQPGDATFFTCNAEGPKARFSVDCVTSHVDPHHRVPPHGETPANLAALEKKCADCALMQEAYAHKLEALRAEKEEAQLERQHLLAVVRRLTLENQRLKAGLRAGDSEGLAGGGRGACFAGEDAHTSFGDFDFDDLPGCEGPGEC